MDYAKMIALAQKLPDDYRKIRDDAGRVHYEKSHAGAVQPYDGLSEEEKERWRDRAKRTQNTQLDKKWDHQKASGGPSEL